MGWALLAGVIAGWGLGYPFGKRMERAAQTVEAARRMVASPFGPVQAGLFHPENSNVIPLRRSNHNGAA